MTKATQLFNKDYLQFYNLQNIKEMTSLFYSRKRMQIFLVLSLLVCSTIYGQGNKYKKDYFVFAYFYGNERHNEGLRLALSKDGINWDKLKNDKIVFHPGFGEFFRDPSLIRDVHDEEVIHMVWTTGSNDGFGIASTRDLINWFDVREIKINKNVPGVLNTWAPELIWDESRNEWMVYFASSVQGRFIETEYLSANQKANNRMYYAFSKDLKTWTDPILLQDHGFISNDNYIYKLSDGHPRGKYLNFVKDIQKPGVHALIREAYSDNLTGPYEITDTYLSKNYNFFEGPTLIKIKGNYFMYCDLTRLYKMSLFRTKDLGSGVWEDLTDILKFPEGGKHGTPLRVDRKTFKRLAYLE